MTAERRGLSLSTSVPAAVFLVDLVAFGLFSWQSETNSLRSLEASEQRLALITGLSTLAAIGASRRRDDTSEARLAVERASALRNLTSATYVGDDHLRPRTLGPQVGAFGARTLFTRNFVERRQILRALLAPGVARFGSSNCGEMWGLERPWGPTCATSLCSGADIQSAANHLFPGCSRPLRLVPPIGLEPMTRGLRIRCSTN